MLMTLICSMNVFAAEYSDNDYQSAALINEGEIVELTFNSASDVFLYKFNAPYENSSIVIEFMSDGSDDFSSTGIMKEYFISRVSGNAIMTGFTHDDRIYGFSGNMKVRSGDKAYARFSLDGQSNPAVLNKTFKFRYKVTPYNISGWENAIPLSNGANLGFNFSNMENDYWYKVNVTTDKATFQYEAPERLNGCFVMDIYTESDVSNSRVSEYSYSIVPMRASRIKNGFPIEPGTYYIHIYPSGLYDDILNKNISLTFLDEGTASQPSAPADNKVKTSFGATVSDWAAPEIEVAFQNNLIPEMMTNFDLTKKVNRGEFATIALQLYDVLTKGETALPANCPFVDINGDVNEQAIKKAFGIDVAWGISETMFKPADYINREQLATMLCRVIKKYSNPGWNKSNDNQYYMDISGVQPFADDADISEWAKPSVYYMSRLGIVKGVDDSHFAPKNTTTQQEVSDYASATREQAIIISQRIFRNSGILK